MVTCIDVCCNGGTGREQLWIFRHKTCKLGPDFKTLELELYSIGSKDSWDDCKNQSNMIKNELIR